ncbi:hypothetical protein WA026_019783 [Henosepilachna vigintioctopunctata]|uniref:DUF4200 domain-containing protein n=1 Tax=Henosepilachna vigintioctopunctata TaxID=420089 RepID=A0AAW1VFP8_9CUCU
MAEKSDDGSFQAFIATGKKIKNKIKAVSTSPEKNVNDSWHLKTTRLPRLQLPNLDTPPMSIELEYSMAKNRLAMTDERLAKKRRNLVKKVSFLNQQWKTLKHKEDMLREEFRKFNKFLRTNMDKRERALKKYAFDRDTNLRRTSEVNNLSQKCEHLKITLANMQKQIAKISIYDRYLERVMQASGGEFKDSCEILPRVEVLLTAKEEIRDRHQQQMECLQDTVGYSTRFVGSKMLTVLNLTGLLPVYKTKYEETQFRRLELEYLLVNLKAKLTTSI